MKTAALLGFCGVLLAGYVSGCGDSDSGNDSSGGSSSKGGASASGGATDEGGTSSTSSGGDSAAPEGGTDSGSEGGTDSGSNGGSGSGSETTECEAVCANIVDQCVPEAEQAGATQDCLEDCNDDVADAVDDGDEAAFAALLDCCVDADLTDICDDDFDVCLDACD